MRVPIGGPESPSVAPPNRTGPFEFPAEGHAEGGRKPRRDTNPEGAQMYIGGGTIILILIILLIVFLVRR